MMSEIFNSVKKCFVPPVSIHINGLVVKWLLVSVNKMEIEATDKKVGQKAD